jgi:hypothetical protein
LRSFIVRISVTEYHGFWTSGDDGEIYQIMEFSQNKAEDEFLIPAKVQIDSSHNSGVDHTTSITAHASA